MNKERLKEAVGELDLVDIVFESDGVSYIDTAVSVMQVYDLIDQLDEPEKVVIPQFVADWWERDGDSVTLYGGLQVKKEHKFDLVSSFHDKGLGDYLSKVEEWVEENKSTFLDLVNGKTYEIEKEELYQVIIPTKDAAWKYYYLDYDGGINAGNDLEYVECHTETFIRSVSDDLWQFAVGDGMTEEENLLVRIKFILDMYSSGVTSAEGALEQILDSVDELELEED